MNVLSLFDGISCAQVALERAGIKYDNYYASEIDKYAIAVTQHRYPKTIQLGDVCGVQYENGAVFHHQNDDPLKNGGSYNQNIDLLMGGSPCQGFSAAGKRQAFDDPRSKLFFEFVRILKEVRPRYFLLENVRMKKEYLDIITSYLGVEPIKINSSLVSAQNRVRYYWTNIPNVTQPEDKHIHLRDVLENETEQIVGLYHLPHGFKKEKYEKVNKYPSLHAQSPGNNHFIAARRGRYEPGGTTKQRLESRRDGKTNALTSVQKDNLVMVGHADLKGHDSIKRVYNSEGKAPTLTSMGGGHREPKVALNDCKWRKLTPLECERLQTLPDNYTLVPWQNRMMSNSQRYKQIGNGWTVGVISHILKGIKNA